ncbi:MAG: hypothetical protein AAB539_02310 [Patescibacteria group bacterium]
MTAPDPRLYELLSQVFEHPTCDFYRRHYANSGIRTAADATAAFDRLPALTRAHLARTPLAERLFFEERCFVKIIRSTDEPFLMRANLSALSKEQYGVRDGARALVFLADSDEAMEKSLWCYEQNILPMVCEKQIAQLAPRFAADYTIDTLLTEENMIIGFWPEFTRLLGLTALKNLVLFGSGFHFQMIHRQFLPQNPVLILSLPETGAIARICPDAFVRGNWIFHPDANCLIEIDERIIMTKLARLATPLIRYDTGINARKAECPCSGGRQAFMLV